MNSAPAPSPCSAAPPIPRSATPASSSARPPAASSCSAATRTTPSPSKPSPARACSACAGPRARPHQSRHPGSGAPAPIRDPSRRGRPLQPRPRPRARNGRRLDRRPLRSRRPHQLRHHARHLRPRQGHRTHRRQHGGAQSRAAIHCLRHRAPHLSRALLAARFMPADAAGRSPSSTSMPPSTRASPAPRACCRKPSAPKSTARSAPRRSARPPRVRSRETLALYAEARRRHYRSLATFWRFGKGWLARVDRTLGPLAIAAATGSPPHRAEGASPTRRGEGLGWGAPTPESRNPQTLATQGDHTHDRYNTARHHPATRPTPNGGASR